MARDILSTLRSERTITQLYAPFLFVSFLFFHWTLFKFNRPPWGIEGDAMEFALAIRIGYGLAFVTYLLALATDFPFNRNFSLLCMLASSAILARQTYFWGTQKYEMMNATNGWDIAPTWAFYLSYNTLLAATILSILRFPRRRASDE